MATQLFAPLGCLVAPKATYERTDGRVLVPKGNMKTSLETSRVKSNGGSEHIEKVVELPRLDFQTVNIQVEGISPLIVHAWSTKARTMMLNKQMGKASKGREKKDPLQDFRGSLYQCGKDQWGIPAPAFKAAAVTAANSIELKMTQMRMAFHVFHHIVPITAKPLEVDLYTEWDKEYAKELKAEHAAGLSMREDLVRLESGVADIRFRGSWPKWGATMQIEYNASMITLDQLTMLFEAAGYGCGIGEWRPSSPVCRSGEFGRFKVKRV